MPGLDMDRGLLEREGRFLGPLHGDWLHRRARPLAVELYHGSCGHEAGAKVLENGKVQAVTAIELVEHLQPATLATFPSTVLGVIQPSVWVVDECGQI